MKKIVTFITISCLITIFDYYYYGKLHKILGALFWPIIFLSIFFFFVLKEKKDSQLSKSYIKDFFLFLFILISSPMILIIISMLLASVVGAKLPF